jgi:thiamine biosynthesis lipoprotein
MLGLGVLYLWVTWNIKQGRDLVRVKQDFAMMGTLVEITVVAPKAKEPQDLIEGARKEIARVEDLFSPYKKDSVVSRLNDLPAGTPLRLKPEEMDVMDVFEDAHDISESSDGAFDITFASVGDLWSFDPQNPRIPTQEEIAKALPRIGYRNVIADRQTATITLAKEGTRVGLGAIAKGAAVDRAVEYLKGKGATGAMVNAGGDLRVFGKKEDGSLWTIQIQHPRDNSRRIPEGGLPLDGDIAVATSGDYERAVMVNGKRYHHILNPRTGMPAEGLMSVTVWVPAAMWDDESAADQMGGTMWAPSATRADGLATAFFVLGPEKGLALAERLKPVEAVFITEEGKIVCTPGVPDSIRNARLSQGGPP